MIDATIQQGVEKVTPASEVWNLQLVQCLQHEGEDCPRYDGSGYRPRRDCAGCGEPAGRPGRDGKAMMRLRNRWGWEQPFYCLGCHTELGYELTVPEGMSG